MRGRSQLPPLVLDGSVALVTGAGRGIGRATALTLAARGARVLCSDLDPDTATGTADACRAAGVDAWVLPFDVADGDAVTDAAAQVQADHGALDILVNNAGVGLSGPFLDTKLDDWDWIMGINVMGVVNGCHAFGPAMVERGRGHVVNLSSGLGYMPTATESGYGATKAAVLALSRSLRADWHQYGVGVSAVCPGVINTPIVTSTRYRGDSADPDRIKRVQRGFRHGHRPEKVADAVIDAIERDRPMVTAGFEAGLGWWAQRLLPLRATDRLARLGH